MLQSTPRRFPPEMRPEKYFSQEELSIMKTHCPCCGKIFPLYASVVFGALWRVKKKNRYGMYSFRHLFFCSGECLLTSLDPEGYS